MATVAKSAKCGYRPVQKMKIKAIPLCFDKSVPLGRNDFLSSGAESECSMSSMGGMPAGGGMLDDKVVQ